MINELRQAIARSMVAGWSSRRTWGRGVLVLMILAMLVGPIPSRVWADDDVPRAHPQLLRDAVERPDQTFRVIVARRTNDGDADRYVVSKGKKIKDVASGAFVAEVKGKEIAALAKHRAVQQITPDAVMVNTLA